MKNNVVRIKPDKDGRYFVKFFGTRYEIILEKEEKKKEKASDE